ncbi:MAG: hypothetical protein QM747_22030 [Nocardioides sp.]
MRHTTWRSSGIAAGALLLAAALAACGGGSSGSSGTPPTDADKAAFCKAFTDLGADTTPTEAADKLSQVGTPSDIGSAERHGFEVLVAHLRTLPDNANDQAFTRMSDGLDDADQADLKGFLTYIADECQN